MKTFSHALLHSLSWLIFLLGGCGVATPGPVPPRDLEVAKLTARAAREYFREVAANYEQLSHESFATVSDAMRRNVELDSQARAHYGEALKAILQARIVGESHGDALHASAPVTFQAMARGFAEVAQ